MRLTMLNLSMLQRDAEGLPALRRLPSAQRAFLLKLAALWRIARDMFFSTKAKPLMQPSSF